MKKKFRVGRTARAGRSGVSVSLAGERERNLVKQIAKQTRNSVKLRVIPTDIIEKYRKKLISLEPDLHRINEEEKHEKELLAMEKQANRVENLLKKTDNNQRSWFQTKKERKDEKGL